MKNWSYVYGMLVVVSLGAPAADAAGAIELYVAANGSDTNPGTQEEPLQSLEAARDAVRRLKESAKPDGGFTVWLRGGTYYRTDTFELSAKDSGTAQAPVV